MNLFGALCLLALTPSILAAERPQALQARDPAYMPRQVSGYDGKDLKDLVPPKDSDKDKDKPSNFTATVTTSFAPIVVPSKDLPSSATTGSDKDKDKDDKTYQAYSSPSSASPLTPSKDLSSFTTTNSDKDKDKDDKTSSAATVPSFTPIGLPSKDLTSFTTMKSDKDKTKDDKTSTAAPTPSSPINNTALTSDKDKDKDSSTTPLKDKTSSMTPFKDISSKIESLTITNLANLTLSLISPATTLPNSTNSGRSSALLTPPMIMYTITLKPEKPSSSLSSSKTELPLSGTGLPPSKSSDNFSSQPSVTSGFGSTIFPGYSIVPSPSESGTKAEKGSLTNLTSATIPVWTQAMLGNAYGGGFITTPSIFVTRLPFPSGPPGNVPPGYGVPSKSENSTLTRTAPGNQTPAVTPVHGSIFASDSTEAVKSTLPPYQNVSGVPENGPSTSIFATVSSQPKKPEGPGGAKSSITLSLVPTASKVEGTKSPLAPTSSSPSLQSGVLGSMSFGFKSQSATSGEGSSPSSVQSDKSVPKSEGIGGKPEASESTGFDTKSSPHVISGELPTASDVAALQSSQLELAGSTRPLVPTTTPKPGTTRPLVPTTTLKPGTTLVPTNNLQPDSTLPLLSTPGFASGFDQQYPGTLQISSMSSSIVSSLAELASTSLSLLPTSSFASSFGTLEGQTIPTLATPSLSKDVSGSVPPVQTTSLQSGSGGHAGSTAPLEQTPSITANLGNGVAGTTLISSPIPFTSSLGNELAGSTQPLVATHGPISSVGIEIAGTTLPLVSSLSFASELGNEGFGTTTPVVSTSSFASGPRELSGTSRSLTPTPSLASTLENQLAGSTHPLVPTPSLVSSLVSSLGELGGTFLPFMSTSSLGNELGETASPFVSSPSLLSTLGSELAGATQPLLPTPSFAFSSGELVDKTAPISSTSATALAGVKPEGPTLVPTKTGEGAAAESTLASTSAGLKPESYGPVPTVSAKEVAAESTLTSALVGIKPEGSTSAPAATGKDVAAESTLTSALVGIKPEGSTSAPAATGKDVAAESTSASALAGLKSEDSGLIPTVSGKDVAVGSKFSAAVKSEGSISVPTETGKEVTAGLTATPTEESGSTSKASVSLSSGEKPKKATEGFVSSASNTATSQQSASTLSDSALGGGDSKSDTSLPFGGEASVFPSTSSLCVMGGITGVTPNPAAESSKANSAFVTSGSVSGTVGPQSNASIVFNVTPTSIQYFEGSAVHVTWSFGRTLITFLAFLLWL